MAFAELPKRFHAKTRIIYQSAEPYRGRASRPGKRIFQVCLIGHLREEKDPLRAALAVRRLPPESRIQVVHIGLALDGRIERKARAEAVRNPRYRWLGELPHWKTRRILAHSDLAVITLTHGRKLQCLVRSACFVGAGCRLPDTRLDGDFGQEFSRLFSSRQYPGLAALLRRSETDKKFYRRLKHHCGATFLSSPSQARAQRVA